MPVSKPAALCLAITVLALGIGYASLILFARLRFGRTRSRWTDDLLTSLIPAYAIQEQHQIQIEAPAEITWDVARAMNLNQSAVVRVLVRTREFFMGASPSDLGTHDGLIEAALKQGWGLLAEEPGRETVVGAITQPWVGRVVFRPLTPQAFVEFREPDFVKIAWSIRVENTGRGSLLRTETRVQPTDAGAHTKFRRYWSFIMPGVVLIRFALLRMIKREAERSDRLRG